MLLEREVEVFDLAFKSRQRMCVHFVKIVCESIPSGWTGVSELTSSTYCPSDPQNF